MRRILIDFARKRHSIKRGGHERKLTLEEGLRVLLTRPGSYWTWTWH